ncbi:MAG: tetratricopeptide repeat protein, partial [Gemmatimonadetes bacterium]|nr:tetratricopeptide repeat protein [Gemmatimonadota bacterium]
MAEPDREGIARLEAAVSSEPGGRAFAPLAEAYRRAGDLGRARRVLAAGLARHPDYASAHVVLARVLRAEGDSEGAETEFRRVLDLDPDNIEALEALAELAREASQPGEALGFYERLRTLEPEDASLAALVKELREAAALTEAAPAAWDLAADSGEIPGPAGDLAAVEAGAGGEEGVLQLGGESGPPPLIVTETMAELYAAQGQQERAAEIYRELSRRHPDDTKLPAKLAELEAMAAPAGPVPAEEMELPAGVGSPLDSEGPAAAGWDDLPDLDLPGLEEPVPRPSRPSSYGADDLGLDLLELEPQPAGGPAGAPRAGEEAPPWGPPDESGMLGSGAAADVDAPGGTLQEPPSERPPEPGIGPITETLPESRVESAAPGGAEIEADGLPELVESAWTGRGGAAGAERTPYAWSEGEAAGDDGAVAEPSGGEYVEPLASPGIAKRAAPPWPVEDTSAAGAVAAESTAEAVEQPAEAGWEDFENFFFSGGSI